MKEKKFDVLKIEMVIDCKNKDEENEIFFKGVNYTQLIEW
jgi:hypothetical protein